jgi:metal-responsive CopG/Arc/MetJ family transcriptional regulator
MAKRKEKQGGKRNGAGRPLANPEQGKAVRVAVTMPPELFQRLDVAAKQIGRKAGGRSAIVVAGLRAILSQTPDRLMEQIGG